VTLALGILVADPAMLTRALDLGRGADDAQLFLMDEGVRAAADPRLRAAIDDGLEAALCAMDAEARGVAFVDGGPRFGSQFDHAVMLRDAVRVVAMTGGRIDDNEAALLHEAARARGVGRRRVAVRLTRAAEHPKVAQALRSAVAYAAVELDVTIVVEPPARALLAHDDHPAPLLRALGTLRALGHRLVEVASPSTRVSCDVEISW
jgi:hypothetical protein